MADPPISSKANRVLKGILIAFLIIVLRIWHLGVVQREEKLLESERPKQRTIILKANRGTICDRFNIPLAINRICYNAAIYYGQIAQIPTISWQTGESGKRVRIFPRKEYIRNLSEILSRALQMDADRIEDLIHSKASLFPHVPFIIKSGLSEEEHYRLRMLEKDWLGIHAEIASERFYPHGKTASHIIGAMGAINQKEYSRIAEEIHLLQETLKFQEMGLESSLPPGYISIESVYQRLGELKEKAYTINDLVGKTGIEATLEEDLRGFFGKKTFEVDQKGRSLRELPGGREAAAGKKAVLSISLELQEFAEALLAQSEKKRENCSLGTDPLDKKRKIQKQPWIKGGAIVALDPNTGEVLALASYPRFDPNDFIPSANASLREKKQIEVCRWLENEAFIGALWDGKELLKRESIHFTEEEKVLDWEFYLDLLLPKENPLRNLFSKSLQVADAIRIQEDFEELLFFSKLSDPKALLDQLFPPDGKPSRVKIDQALNAQKRLELLLGPISSNSDKLFAIDLCRMLVYSPAFSDALLKEIGSLKIDAYRSLCQSVQRLEAKVKRDWEQKFHETEFRIWKEAHQKEFLAQKREEEREAKTYARPYVDYLDKKEKEQFALLWEEKRGSLLFEQRAGSPELEKICKQLNPELSIELICTLRSFNQLSRPLLGSYSKLHSRGAFQTEKDLAAAFYPTGGFGFSRSYAFQGSAPQGSIFKLVTAFEALRQNKSLTLIDELGWDPKNPSEKGEIVAYTLNKNPYLRFYKGGRLPRSHASSIGKIDLAGALEQSSNPYFSILAGDLLENPEDLSGAARLLGLGEKTGIELPGEIRGRVPTDLKSNRTGLYSTAIGQHTLLSTPLQSAALLALIANGGDLLKPKIVKEAIGLTVGRKPLDAFAATNYLAKAELSSIGIHFPLFTAVHKSTSRPVEKKMVTEVKRTVPLSDFMRHQLLEGMDRAVWGPKGSARPTAIKLLLSNPLWMRDYLSLQHQMIGKTSTAEILYNPNINPSSKPQVYKHISFGAIAFETDPHHPTRIRRDRPELIVIVFLRYGDGGKEAAPYAAQMIRKWREIKKSHSL